MSKNLDDIRRYKIDKYNSTEIFKLIQMKRVLEKLIPEHRTDNIGEKYTRISLNFFRNDAVRDII